MPHLYGENWNRRSLERYTGARWQVGGVRHLRLVEGVEEGTEVVQLVNDMCIFFSFCISLVIPYTTNHIAKLSSYND